MSESAWTLSISEADSANRALPGRPTLVDGFGLQAVWNGSVANPARFVSVPAGGDVHPRSCRDREHGRDDGRGPIRLNKVATVDNNDARAYHHDRSQQ